MPPVSFPATPPSSLAELPGGITRGFVAEAAAAPCPTGHEALDRLLRGGFPRGHLSEVVGAPSSGRTSLVYALLRSATSRGEVAGLVEPADRFDPAHAAAAGIVLS
ncbi:MAG: hypothetical protein ACREQ9_15790, partial [Candidatus Binatia bacterium]